MRSSLLLLAVLFSASFAFAQDDPGTQAMQANQQASEEMQRVNQEANAQMMREMQSSSDAAQEAAPTVAITATPKISVKSGKYPGPITVKLSDKSRGAFMY